MKKTNETICIGEIKAAPGECSRGYVNLGTRADCSQFRIPLTIINGTEPGPVLYMQSISDGDELNGIGVMQRVLGQLSPETLKGAVIAVPLVNVHAFIHRTSASPIDKKKMNRCFPGNKNGSSSERIAHYLFNNAIVRADYCIDLHQGGINPMVDECRVRVNKNERAGAASLELARIFGIGYIYHQKGPEGQLARAAPARGIPTIDPELGGARGWVEESIQKGVRGVFNVLKHYGFIAGKAEIPKRQVVARGLKPVYADCGGFLKLYKTLYDEVKRGEKVADILDLFGSKIGEAYSNVNGIVWRHTPYPMVATGERIFNIGTPVSHI